MKKIKISIISLGCARNLVDSELMAGQLREEGFFICDDVDGSEVVIINTCAFIEDAKREAIDVILKAANLKKDGRIRKLIVCGCFSQRYSKELERDIPEIDAILGVDSFKNITEAVKTVISDKNYKSINPPTVIYLDKYQRQIMTPTHYAYLKIAEGCNNRCSYCAIYKIRGNLRSRPIESILREVKNIASKRNLSELNVIAQDTTSYICLCRKRWYPEL